MLLWSLTNGVRFFLSTVILAICIVCGVKARANDNLIYKHISILSIPLGFYILFDSIISVIFTSESSDVAEQQGNGWGYIFSLVGGMLLFSIIYGLITFKATKSMFLPALANGVSSLVAYPIFIVSMGVMVITLVSACVGKLVYICFGWLKNVINKKIEG